MQTARMILADTGERMIPPLDEEISFVFARHRFAYQYVSQFVKGCSVADIGCGTGYGCKLLAGQARFVCGIDYDFGALSYCKNIFGSSNIYYAQMNAMSLGLKRVFDMAISFQVIEHMADVHCFVEQLKQIVKPGGKLFISTPNVPISRQSNHGNPFHQNEMDYHQFRDLLRTKFSSFYILGIFYESNNLFRRVIQKLPFYRWGARLKRRNKIKMLANRVLDLTKFRITDDDLPRSMDLIAVCQND